MTSFDESNSFDVDLNEPYHTSERAKNAPTIRAGRRHDDPENHNRRNPFFVPFCLILAFAVIELATGVWSHSLALLSDAWHMFSDVFAIGLAMTAFRLSNKVSQQASAKTSKAELNVSIINALLMLAVIGWIVHEAWLRFDSPANVQSGVVVVVAMIGLLINLFVAQHLHFNNPHHQHAGHQHHGHDHQHLNHEAAMLHVIGDILGSVAALVSGIVIYFSGWMIIDPILSLFIAGLLLIGTLGLFRNIAKVLRQ